jgi:nucleoside-diphosphate-sugar epimerase
VVWGAGTLGGAVATAWAQGGEVALGATESERRHAALRAAGVEPLLGSPVAALRPEDTLLLALPGSEAQATAVRALAEAGPPPARVVLVGTVGVYGDPQGTVDESCPRGTGPRTLITAAAEAVFAQWAGPAGVILRAAGLYQPGRGPMSALARSRKVPPGPGNRTLALIHYADAAAATFAALRHPAPRPLYVLATPPLPTRADFYQAACVILDLPAPRFEAPLPHPPARYVVDAMRHDLLPTPAHPRWQAALVPPAEESPR